MDIDTNTTTSYALANWLRKSAELEGYAAGCASLLGHGTLVTPEERDFVLDVIYPEELAHRDILKGMARTLLVKLPEPMDLPRMNDMLDIDILMLLTRGEGALLLEIKKFESMMDHNEFFLAGLKKIEWDEQAHRRWSRGVVHRLHNEGRVIPAHVLRSFPPFHEVRAVVEEVRASQERST